MASWPGLISERRWRETASTDFGFHTHAHTCAFTVPGACTQRAVRGTEHEILPFTQTPSLRASHGTSLHTALVSGS